MSRVTSDPDVPMRSRLIEAAARLLAEQGPGALSARKVAAEVDASTMAVYTHVGGMAQLIRGVAEEGFARLAQNLSELAASDDPVADVARQGLAYRQTALDNPHLYAVMFGSTPLGAYRPSSDELPGRDTFESLVAATRRAMDAGRFRQADPAAAATQLWSALHGLVTLELAGYFHQSIMQTSEDVLASLFSTLAIGLGDTPELAVHSIATLDLHHTAS